MKKSPVEVKLSVIYSSRMRQLNAVLLQWNFNDSVVFCPLGVHQVALLTHIDQICPQTAKDATRVYKSHNIRDAVGWNKPYEVCSNDHVL